MPMNTINYESLFPMLLRTEHLCQAGLKLGSKFKSYLEKQACNHTIA